jgi:hypothetical protein
MSFNQGGFLSKEAESYPGAFRALYKRYFDIMLRTNDSAYTLLTKVDKKTDSHIQRLTVVTLYLRCLNAFAAIFRLLELGLGQEAGIVIRSLVELTLYLRMASRDEKWTKDYVDLSLLHDLKYLRANYGDPEMLKTFTPEVKQAVVEKINWLEDQVKKLGLKKMAESPRFNAYEIAKQLDFLSLYDTAFRMFSTESSHASSNSLDRFLKGENGKLQKLIHGPDIENIHLVSATACTCVHLAMQGIEKTFSESEAISSGLLKELSTFSWKQGDAPIKEKV